MIKIGEFSKLTLISIRMLRYYDEIGLLVPEKIDDENRYRYYNVKQLEKASYIQSLKQLGFEINLIKQLLEKENDLESITKLIKYKYGELEKEKIIIENKLKGIKSMLMGLEKGGNGVKYNVQFKEIEEMNIAYVRGIVKKYEKVGELWEALEEEAIEYDEKNFIKSYTMQIYNDKGYKDEDVDLSVCVRVHRIEEDGKALKFKALKKINVASVTFKGSYMQMPQVCKAIGEWIDLNEYEISGKHFVILHKNPNNTKEVEEYITEVCFPIKKSK